MAAPDRPDWKITHQCRWCGGQFVRLEIDHGMAWLCESEACRERQLRWKRVDLAGKLFYLPMPVQCELHETIASQQYGAICIGGERGSSKSIAVRNAIYNACEEFPEFTALLFRRTLVDLELNQWRFFEREAPRLGLDWSSKRLRFPKTGSEVRPCHSKDPEDYKKYIGGDVDLIVNEQLEEFLQKQAVEIGAATGRSTRYGDAWRGLWLNTENPGGPLSDFVNQMFVRKDLDKTRYPEYDPSDYCFIEARLSDNPWTDTRYSQKLAILSPGRRAMMRFGDRRVFDGQFFQEWEQEKHVTDDVLLLGATHFLSLRFAYNREGYAILWAVLPTRRLFIRGVFRFEQLNEDALARELKTFCAAHGVTRLPITFGNPELFAEDHPSRVVGQSIAETMQYYGIPIVESDPDEFNGWKRVHALLRDAPDGQPWLLVSPTAKDLIAAMATAMSDEDEPDVLHKDTPGKLLLEAVRFGAMSRPMPELKPEHVVYPAGSMGWYLQRAQRENRVH